ncbi:MAG: NADP oxidoreductase, partial [Candidatus Glassbacteria bacterium]|nr:NADP oxidoreductase [Candidatus Glassbacteria bacterium]
DHARAVQIGGPSGRCIGHDEFDRKICYDDLSTGGAMIVIGPQRDLLKIVFNFARFFEEESCGWCIPCRVGNRLLKNKLEKILAGNGTRLDLDELEEWGKIISSTARCGLGTTSPNPILTTLTNFRHIYEERLKEDEYLTGFDLTEAVAEACEQTGRSPHFE